MSTESRNEMETSHTLSEMKFIMAMNSLYGVLMIANSCEDKASWQEPNCLYGDTFTAMGNTEDAIAAIREMRDEKAYVDSECQ